MRISIYSLRAHRARALSVRQSCDWDFGPTIQSHLDHHNHHGKGEQNGKHDHEYILPIVAIDVAGTELGYPASDHKESFNLAHQSFLNKTLHADEAYGPKSIVSAITDLHAERIGHKCNLFRWDVIGEGEGQGGKSKSNKEKEEMTEGQKQAYVENLTRYLGAMRTFMEVCLSSNLQTLPELEGDLWEHPACKITEEGLVVMFCTNNALVLHTNMVRELTLAVEAFELCPWQMRYLFIMDSKGCLWPRDIEQKGITIGR